MRLWHLLVRQVYKSGNPENLIILKILVQTTVRGQSTQSTPNTRVVFVPTLWAGNLSAPRFVIGVENTSHKHIWHQIDAYGAVS